jgi:hypothetical protein
MTDLLGNLGGLAVEPLLQQGVVPSGLRTFATPEMLWPLNSAPREPDVVFVCCTTVAQYRKAATGCSCSGRAGTVNEFVAKPLVPVPFSGMLKATCPIVPK